jgi:RNA polymerase sigma factor (sigma-70 family)
MDELIKLVRLYRLATTLDERLGWVEKIFCKIEPKLRLFVFGLISRPEAEDALQEVLKAVATSLKKFNGNTTEEFWGWCYRIARNKLNDCFRAKAADRAEPMPPEEMWRLIDESAQDIPMSAADRLDLDHAMRLLTASKPECHELLWNHFVIGFNYQDIAEEQHLQYDNVRIKIGRCLETARSLIT